MGYHALNKQTVKDLFPLPRIDQLLDRLGQARVLSKLDLTSGYHQIAVAEDSLLVYLDDILILSSSLEEH